MKLKQKMIRASGSHALVLIAASFLFVILIGSILLSMPWATQTGKSIGWFDALFTSTSAVCVTGLVVRDTGTTFNLFGQIVLLLLIQIGGLGLMTFAMLIVRMLGREASLRQRMLIRESMNEENVGGMESLILWVVKSAFTVELCGAAILSIRMIPYCGSIVKGLWFSLFHAVSAFCNAGFDLMGNSQSLMGFRGDVVLNFAMIGLVVIGGLGFGTLRQLFGMRKKGSYLRLNTRIVLVTYGVLMIFGFLFTLLAEWDNPGTLGNLPFREKLLAALFQSMTLRTAGFNTIDQQALMPASKMVDSILMIIGASPASTGGGIKVTTVAVIFLMVHTTVMGKRDIVCFRRTITPETAKRAVSVAMVAIGIMLLDTIVISLIQPELGFMDILFECSSAIGTVGISAFGSANLTVVPRIMIILTMYAGRIGPLTLALILAHRQNGSITNIDHPEGTVMIG